LAQTFSATTAGFLLFFLAVWAAAGGNPAAADERNFRLEQATAYSLHHNGDLKALREERRVREAGRIRAGLYPNPVLGLDGASGNLSGSPYENRVSVGISQELLTMGKRGKRLQVAEKDLEGFDRQIANAGRLLTEEVKTAFYKLCLAEKRLELSERSIALNKQLLAITKQRLEADDIPELDMNLAKVEAARSEGKKVEAEGEFYLAKAKLLSLMGFPPDEKASFSHSPLPKPFTKTPGQLKGLALANRPDVRALESEKEKSDAAVSLAQAEAIPNVTAGLGVQREHKSLEVAGNDVKGLDNLIGLKISIPLPLFDRNQAGVLEAQARKGSAENRLLFARQVVEREVEAAYARLMTAEKSLLIYARDIVPQLEENLKLVQEAYSLGEVGILPVIEEQKKFFEVNDGYLAALYNRQSSLVRLEAVVGIALSPETGGGGQ